MHIQTDRNNLNMQYELCSEFFFWFVRFNLSFFVFFDLLFQLFKCLTFILNVVYIIHFFPHLLEFLLLQSFFRILHNFFTQILLFFFALNLIHITFTFNLTIFDLRDSIYFLIEDVCLMICIPIAWWLFRYLRFFLEINIEIFDINNLLFSQTRFNLS